MLVKQYSIEFKADGLFFLALHPGYVSPACNPFPTVPFFSTLLSTGPVPRIVLAITNVPQLGRYPNGQPLRPAPSANGRGIRRGHAEGDCGYDGGGERDV